MSSKVRIKSVSFRSCVSIGSYQTVHVEASADVLLNQTPEQVVDKLKVFVAAELRRAKEGDPKKIVERREVIARQGRFRELLDAE